MLVLSQALELLDATWNEGVIPLKTNGVMATVILAGQIVNKAQYLAEATFT
jgi:hypothetical protein